MFAELKSKILRLLREDEEFRYAVAGLIGLEEILKRIDTLTEEQTRIWEEIKALREEQTKMWHEIQELRKEQTKMWEEIKTLRKDMNEGFRLLRRHIDALGARWGLLAEEAFREGLKGLVERVLGGKVEKWSHYDKEGVVFGHPSMVDVDLIVKDREHILVEVKSSVSRGDVYELWRIGKLYERVEGIKPKLVVVSPYIEDTAKKTAEKLGIETYTP